MINAFTQKWPGYQVTDQQSASISIEKAEPQTKPIQPRTRISVAGLFNKGFRFFTTTLLSFIKLIFKVLFSPFTLIIYLTQKISKVFKNRRRSQYTNRVPQKTRELNNSKVSEKKKKSKKEDSEEIDTKYNAEKEHLQGQIIALERRVKSLEEIVKNK
ncbi:MAG: hypothetical protein AAF502_17225 [Bacteroidota bacterium]